MTSLTAIISVYGGAWNANATVVCGVKDVPRSKELLESQLKSMALVSTNLDDSLRIIGPEQRALSGKKSATPAEAKRDTRRYKEDRKFVPVLPDISVVCSAHCQQLVRKAIDSATAARNGERVAVTITLGFVQSIRQATLDAIDVLSIMSPKPQVLDNAASLRVIDASLFGGTKSQDQALESDQGSRSWSMNVMLEILVEQLQLAGTDYHVVLLAACFN